MSTALKIQPMTREAFLDWADAREDRYEFDGFQPVATTGGLVNHSRITLNIHFALRTRLAGSGCESLGPDAGIATVGDAVRYPDALVTCRKTPGSARLVEGVVAVFEVVSKGNPGLDRIAKVREYAAVPSIRTYGILEQQSVGITVLERRADGDWATTVLTAEDTLRLPHPAITIPVADLYEGTDLPRSGVAQE